MQTEKNNETKTGWTKKRNCQRRRLYSFNYIIVHMSICFFFYLNSLHRFVWLLLYYLLHLLSSHSFAALTSLETYKHFIWIYEFFKNHPQKRNFSNVSLSNLENASQKSLSKHRARKCIFRASGGTHFEKFSGYVIDAVQIWSEKSLQFVSFMTILIKKPGRTTVDKIRN